MDDKLQNADSQPLQSSAAEEKQRRDRMAIRDIWAFLIKLAVVLLAGWILFGFVFGVAIMEGEDMYPRIRDGDLLVYYRLQEEYHIGDVATFSQDGRRYTGRIVAQGGDTVDISEDGQLLINGSIQDEEIFYPTETVEGGISLPYTIPEGEVFLLCDFRTTGVDSRTYGSVELGKLDGKVITILRRRGI